jgi:dienelactone hydrolase
MFSKAGLPNLLWLARLLALPVWLASVGMFSHSAPPSSSLQQIPVLTDDESIRLQMRIYKPDGEGPFPTLIFNHGSTGYSTDPERFKESVDAPAVAEFFVQRGWAVVMPARRGRAGSDGRYDEGLSVNRAGYSCDSSLSLAGADRALRDIDAAVRAILDAAVRAILDMPFVDAKRIVVGGVSRGGVLSVAYSGMYPTQVIGVINFVGGWLGTPCPTMSSVNRSLFIRGAAYPGESIWLYAENDPYYPLSHSRENFTTFTAAGGKGLFVDFAVPAEIGHSLAAFPLVWASILAAYLQRVQMPSRAQGANPLQGLPN